jgi:CheY-like chemotaxis protein
VPVDVSQSLGGMSDLLTHSLGSTVNLEIVSIPDVWWAHTDPNQLENAVLNLAVNGRDAMDGGGRLIIHAANCDVRGDEDIRTLGVPEGQYVVIEVSDTGAGMSPDVSARAFDPFFTTKKVGQGTGLGLSQVYGFVKQCAGHVKISSALGRGTSVKIYLPRFLTKVDQATGSLPRSPALQTAHQELIVVVDDEPVVREFSCEALTALGYRVIACEDAASALDALDQNADVALLFTDVVMPDINGRELADRAWKRNASLKVLFTSGYTRNDALLSGVLSEDVHLLGKPFTVEQLSKKISAILASADALSENQL